MSDHLIQLSFTPGDSEIVLTYGAQTKVVDLGETEAPHRISFDDIELPERTGALSELESAIQTAPQVLHNFGTEISYKLDERRKEEFLEANPLEDTEWRLSLSESSDGVSGKLWAKNGGEVSDMLDGWFERSAGITVNFYSLDIWMKSRHHKVHFKNKDDDRNDVRALMDFADVFGLNVDTSEATGRIENLRETADQLEQLLN